MVAGVDGLHERERESAVLAGALAGAREGGSLVVVEGPPGIGKTRLLQAARRQAREDGLLTLAARGSELEQRVPFGMLRQLLEPVVLGAEPSRRAELFEGAAALAESVFDQRAASGGEVDDVFPTLHGLFWLVSNLGRERPLALLFDDAQWSDAPSLHFLAYLAPRLDDLATALIVGTRPAVEAGDPLLMRIVTDPAARVLRPQPLSAVAVADWAGSALGAEPAEAFVAACAAATGGNPFFVGELLREIGDRRLAPDAASAGVVGGIAPHGVAAMVMLRLAAAPAGARELAEAVAVLGAGAKPDDAAALAGLEPGAARAAAAALVSAGILTDDAQPGFVHPVLRAAVEQAMPAARRARAHADAARMLQQRGAPVEDVAAHLLLAPPAGDPETVGTLRAAARRAVGLGVPASAVAPLERALAEPPPAGEQPELLVELGRAAAAAGSPGAAAHLRRAIDTAPDPQTRARAALELARVAKYGGGGPEAAPVVESCLAETRDPALAELLEVELHCMASVSRSVRQRLRERIEALREPEPGATGAAAACAWAALAFEVGARGTSAARAVELAGRVPGALRGNLESPGDWLLLMATAVSIWCEGFEQAERLCDLLIADARRRGTALPISGAAGLRSLLNIRRGRLAEAEADAKFALGLADEVHGIDVLVTLARSSAALAAVDRGAPAEELREWLARLEGDRPDFLPFGTILHARGNLLLALGEPRAALGELRELARLDEGWGGGPGTIMWRSDAALALQRLGEGDEARRLAAEEVELARRFGAPRALGVALRAAALVSERSPVAGLREAVEVLERGDAPLELARALVDLGAAMRRGRKGVDAREPLRRGAELALHCGAHGLVRRAREELLASGARPRRLALRGAEALTPSERRVAELAAAGRSNREIAQELYVTEKTVEGHLSHSYDKLGIRSRGELPDALAS